LFNEEYRYLKPPTWGALMPTCYAPIPPYPGFLIRVGARGDYVRQIQSCLNSVNNAGLATDGICGPLTQAAVINYQRANGLSADGIVGPITWEHLMRRCGGGIIPVGRALAEFDVAVDTEDVEVVPPLPVVPPPPPPPPAKVYDPVTCPVCNTIHHHCDVDVKKQVNYMVVRRMAKLR
jgi:peptidoglycan hydrolase-like protein with peptidoglycan-binding domain